jgi:2,3-bisphosphoglycerate-dependent phosphoglycerate mutase
MIKAGKKILIVGHENLLRGIIKHLDDMTNEQIMAINIPNGIPFVYELDENLKPVMSMQFLGGGESVKKVIKSVPAHGKVKKLIKDNL